MAFLVVWQVFNALANQKLPPPLASNCSLLQRSLKTSVDFALIEWYNEATGDIKLLPQQPTTSKLLFVERNTDNIRYPLQK